MKAQNYLPEVDGLRALAVLSVLFFHVDISIFSGGFVGVDVFFVISGFLITRLIYGELNENRFSFANFYVRRVRRLLPALIVTIAGALLVSAVLFLPNELERSAGAALHALVSLSNFYFWAESGYFDADAAVKPFLHTWSLSVEEQFYLMWPALMVFMLAKLKKLVAISFIAIAGIASVIAGELFLSSNPIAVFYLTPFRLSEFAVGAILALAMVNPPPSSWRSEAAMTAGLLLTAYAIFAFSAETRFPGLLALVPAIGTGLMIFGSHARFAASLFRTKPVIYLGQISYSLYLVHWPIIVFAKYGVDGELMLVHQAFVILGSIALAAAMKRFIEDPFRRPRNKETQLSSAGFSLVCALSVVVLSAAASNAWANKGWPWRFGDLTVNFDLDSLRLDTMELRDQLSSPANFSVVGRRIVVVGDSHGYDTTNALSKARDVGKEEVLFQPFDDDCAYVLKNEMDKIPEARHAVCQRQAELFKNSLKIQNADVIVFSSLWSRGTIALMPELVALARKTSVNQNTQIVIVGTGDRFMHFHRRALSMLKERKSRRQVNEAAFEIRWTSSDGQDDEIIKIADANDVIYLSRHEIVCDDKQCEFLLEGNVPAFWDHTHWTNDGASLFGKRLKDRLDEAIIN